MRALATCAAVAIAVALAGCIPDLFGGDECAGEACAPCALFATIEVVDATSGAAIRGAAATGGLSAGGGGVAWTCGLETAKSTCSTFPLQLLPVAFDVHVTAPGYASGTVRITPVAQAAGDCCASCQVFPAVQVRLAPL
jgi:hypothetical protein